MATEELVLAELVKIGKTLKRIELILGPTELGSSVEFYQKIGGEWKLLGGKMFLKGDQMVPLSVKFVDKFGNDAKVDGAPAWALTDDSLGVLEVAADGMGATLKAKGLTGVMKVQVSADADLGEGVKAIMGELDVEILPAEAIAVVIAAGDPVALP